MVTAIRSLWTWGAIILLIAVWLPLVAIVRLFDRDPALYRTGRWFRRVGVAMTKVNPFWHIHVSGEYPADPRYPYVVVSNHQSLGDIPIISLLPWEMKWIAKAELFKIPFVGRLMRLAGDIEVNRQDPRSRVRVMITAREYLEKHCSVMFFPEGTRSRDGRVLPFTEGAFRLAVKAQVPILPLALDGTQNALPKHSWKFGNAKAIRLKVLPPVETTGLKAADAETLQENVRTLIMQQIAEWRGVTLAEVDAEADPAFVKDSVKMTPTTG